MWPSTSRPAEQGAPPRCLAHLLAWAPIAWGSLVAGPALAADTGPATLLLALRLNGIEQERPVEALRLGSGLALPQEVWRALRLKPDATTITQHDGQAFQAIDTANGTRWRIDEPSQTLEIDAPAGAFVGGRNPLAADAAPSTMAPGFGGYANYDLQWQRSDLGSASSRSGANALIELGGFGSAGSLRSTGLLRSRSANDGTPGSGRTRLDTTWTIDQPERMTRLQLGDAVSHPGAWGQSLRFAGVQWSTDFALQPGFLSFPLPSLQGEAVLPSTVDLYVNNSRRLQGQVPAGAFDLTELPVVTGQGELRMVVRDLLGREQVIVKPYYTHPWMLRPGLSARALDIGFVREDYGLASNHYGRLLASFSDQLGITEHFTRELRAEAMGDQASAGASGMWLLPAFGSVQVSAVGSHGPSGNGALLAVGADRQARDWNGSLQVRSASRGFTQIGQPVGSAPRLNIATAWGSSWGGSGVGISLVAQRPWQGATQRLLAFNLAHNLGALGTLSAFALRDLSHGSTTVALSLTRALDDRSSAGATVTRRAEGGQTHGFDTLQLQRNVPDGPGFGYQLAADRGDAERYTAQGAWQTEQASFSGGLAHSRGSDDARLGASGGLAWLGDSVFLSRRIEGSFAVVEVGGYPGVQLLHDNRPVARTDAQGRALVSGLRAYEPNRIGVDAADLPFDAEVSALETLLTPPARSGVSLRMAVERVRAASFRLVGPDGRALPAGSLVTITGQTREFPVGFDGRSYVAGLSAQTALIARWPGHECRALMTLPDELDEVPELGTLACR